jgi:lysophospholipase L1-like esterase
MTLEERRAADALATTAPRRVVSASAVPPRGLRIATIGDSTFEGDTMVAGVYPTKYFGTNRAALWRRQRGLGLNWQFVGTLNSYVDPAGGATTGWPGVHLPQEQAYHDGHSSFETQDVIDGKDGSGTLASWLAAIKPFNLAFVGLGTNDVNHSIGADVNGQPGTISNAGKYNNIAARLVTICQTIHSVGGAPSIVRLPPLIGSVGTPSTYKVASMQQTWARIIAALAALPYVAVCAPSWTLYDNCVDGIHPHFSGYQKDTDALWDCTAANAYALGLAS